MFNIKVNSLNEVTDHERNFKIYKKAGNTLLEKDNVKYILPNGNISAINKDYFINGVLINIETPEDNYEKL